MIRTLCLAAVAATMFAGGTEAAPVCLRIYDMLESHPAHDGGSITFRMRDGSVWRNDLQGPCSDLRYDGFVWGVRNASGLVCEDIQPIRVLRSNQTCMLGKFTQLAPSRTVR